MLIIGFATRYEAGGFANIVQKFLHVGKTMGMLHTFFVIMYSGDLTAAAQAGVLDSGGDTWTALGTRVDIGYGFWIMVAGFIISAIGVYTKEK